MWKWDRVAAKWGERGLGFSLGLTVGPLGLRIHILAIFVALLPVASLSWWEKFIGKEAHVGDVCVGAGACAWGTRDLSWSQSAVWDWSLKSGRRPSGCPEPAERCIRK